MRIGVFDSGFGGLTVVKDILRVFGNAKIIYVGDNARVPYGNKSKKTIIKYVRQISNFLLTKKVDILVVACNTASSVALEEVKKISNVPVIGMVEPVVDEAINFFGFKKIGIIGTSSTIRSLSYEKSIKNISSNIEIISMACPLFVPIIEEGMSNHKILKIIAREYLATKFKKVDCLILGCTHYPLIENIFTEILGKNIKILTCGEPAAREIGKKIGVVGDIVSKNCSRIANEFYTTDDIDKFKIIGSKFLGQKINKVKKIDLDEYDV